MVLNPRNDFFLAMPFFTYSYGQERLSCLRNIQKYVNNSAQIKGDWKDERGVY